MSGFQQPSEAPNKRRRLEETKECQSENGDTATQLISLHGQYGVPFPFTVPPSGYGFNQDLSSLLENQPYSQFPSQPHATLQAQPFEASFTYDWSVLSICQDYNYSLNTNQDGFGAPSYPQPTFLQHPSTQHLPVSLVGPEPDLNLQRGCIPYMTDDLEHPENTDICPGSCTTELEIAHQVLSREAVCFGMINHIEGFYKPTYSTGTQTIHLVNFQGPEKFIGIQNTDFQGTVSPSYTHIISAMMDESSLDMEASVVVSEDDLQKTKARGPRFSRSCMIQIVLYGPMNLFEEIGSFFEDHDIYIQDPVKCQRDVPYRNPHRLSGAPNAPESTSELGMMKKAQSSVIQDEDVRLRPDLLDVLNSEVQENLAETEPSPAFKTALKRHQKQALTFMLQREMGWAWDGTRPDIWEAVEMGRDRCFANKVSGSYESDEPPQFYGGIVADPMGLGKTLSMISLIASDLEIDYRNLASLSGTDLQDSSKRTLVIVPPSLLSTWEEQLSEHIHPNRLSWCFHHGKSRLTESKLGSALLIITTYHTVSLDWKKRNASDPPILFKTKWKRVVLDEAHSIRNSESQMARAICEINSVSRWAVTGTPIQNKLGDLVALLKFLRVYPYSQKRAFEADISHLWKYGQDEEAVNRLRRLSGCLILRRSKKILQLQPTHDIIWPVDITSDERNLYNEIKEQAITTINESLNLNDSITRTQGASFVNALQKIEAMRMVCNLGLRYHVRHTFSQLSKGKEPEYIRPVNSWDTSAQKAFDIQRSRGQIQCHNCSCSLDTLNFPSELTEASNSMFSECLGFLCPGCARGILAVPCCSHIPPCAAAPVSLNSDTLDEPPISSLEMPSAENLNLDLPSKINLLLQDLTSLPPDTKSVVFSTWRMTLDVAEAGLRQASIPFLRFDGKVPLKDRQTVVDRFRNDPSIKVLLLTLSCGAVGLTLTQASRAYLMEPHWNPTLEDQALARIHRIGQEKEVTTIRFIVRDSFEERIVELQKSKRDLANILLNANGAKNGSQLDALLRLLT